MAVLSDVIRLQIWRGVMRYWSQQSNTTIPNMTKSDLQLAINAADDWLDANSTLYNAALPILFRVNATNSQKAFILAIVALSRGNSTLLRYILGEVD